MGWKMKGMWITFEGIDGSGKSTLIQQVYNYFKDKQFSVVMTKEPGGTEAGVQLREIVMTPRKNKLLSFTELLIFEADRHETYSKVIAPNLKKGALVLSDRGIDGSIAYQGFGRGLDVGLIDNLTNISTNGQKPDLTILIHIEPKIAIKRVSERNGKRLDQFMLENKEFFSKVSNGFLFTARREPERIFIVDGDLPKNEIVKLTIDIIEKKLGSL
jgi:dTMP kinase